ncbi:unnamed protein product [Lymnaea stagnalis]|uniref:Uncharacterized protein n=1 Tax=Lymnaea stagnalis TaxID=6523 RepID=A0AAV2HLG4_LYMST
MYQCDKLEGLKLLTKCYTHLKEIEARLVPPLDIIRTVYAIGVMMYLNERYADGKYRAQEGLNLCGDKNHPMFKKLLDLNKYCERKLFKEDKNMLESQSGIDDRSDTKLD